MNTSTTLVRNNFCAIFPTDNLFSRQNAFQTIGTLFSNMAYYGYALSKEATEAMMKLSPLALEQWWADMEPVLSELSGDSRKMGDFVVYKNFPQEVLDMSQSEYWFKQICMYFGFPNEWFSETEVDREPMEELVSLKVLHLPDDNTLSNILNGLLKVNAPWTNDQKEDVLFLLEENEVDLSEISFKENLILICTQYFNEGKAFGLSSATDVLRLVVSLSGGDLKSTEKIRIKNLKRSERQFFLNLLENSTDLEEDVLRNKSIFKTFLKGLHVEDYKNKYTKVFEVKNQLFKGKLRSFNSVLEDMILRKDKMVFALLLTAKGRGVFMRSIKRLCDVYGVSLVSYNFAKVVSEYDTVQLLKLKRYMDNVLENKYRFFRPKSSFSKGQILENNVQFDVSPFQNILNAELKTRISKFGNIKTVGNLDQIKFQTTSNEVFSFGKGTEFPIPENVTFIRSASYWENKTHRNNWFDNGWNFFEEDWKLSGSLCWTETDFKNKAAIFSGDPTNSKDVNGRACQMIDLYFDKLVKAGVRYGVWNILCYSKIPFGDASDVFAALQWGENPQKGGLFEPKRCQVSFPLVGDVQNKFIAYVDFKERKLVFLDVTLKADVSSASKNQLMLVEKMPAIVEYLNYVPSLNDLMQFAEYDENQPVDYVVCYSDKDVTLSGEKAYIFKKENEQSKFEDVDINFFLKNQ